MVLQTRPRALAAMPGERELYALVDDSPEIQVIDLSTFTVAATIELGVNDVAVNAASLAISPNGRRSEGFR
ncbi:hypothetical protein [Streptomyces sp. NPDC088789]|uniref:hypothetical protein n=1 Tax=Streptomyces sp. NPDC088789 TaxID=3365899 RepID=UPI0037FFF896